MNRIKIGLAVLMTLLVMGTVQAANLKPFVLASTQSGDVASVSNEVEKQLKMSGFEVIGEYSPYPDATIVGITSPALRKAAGETEFGVFGAAIRVSFTKGKDGKVQVAYNNPPYMAAVYRMKSDLSNVAATLKKAIGAQQTFGSEDGVSAEDLGDYHYKWLMPYFTDRLELGSYKSYEDAVKAVEAGLAAGKGGTKKVYRVDIKEQNASLFAVALTDKVEDECAGDKYIMERIDFKDLKSTGHLPYDIVVKGSAVYALPAEFRIAINFPDLSMMGSNSFASIMCAPNAIEASLTAAGGQAAGGSSTF